MRTLVLVAVASVAVSPALADPVSRVNIALSTGGRDISATTTLEDGGATLQAPSDGEFGLMLQSPLPVDSRLSALVGRDVWSVDLPAGPPSRDAALAFAAREGDIIELCLQSAEGAAPPPDAEEFATLCAPEQTQDAGHSPAPAPDLPLSDLNPALPAPEAVTPQPASPAVR